MKIYFAKISRNFYFDKLLRIFDENYDYIFIGTDFVLIFNILSNNKSKIL